METVLRFSGEFVTIGYRILRLYDDVRWEICALFVFVFLELETDSLWVFEQYFKMFISSSRKLH